MSENIETIGRISPSDHSLMMNARAELQKAQAVWSFISSHLTVVYGLSGDADVNAAGEIVRSVPMKEAEQNAVPDPSGEAESQQGR